MKEPTFALMKLKVVFLKSSKHLLQMMHEISWGEAKNNNVINVALGETKTHQYSIHDSLKLCRAFFKPNGKNFH
jgi:hypothetical protein